MGASSNQKPRKAFFEAYKDIEALWEILSPSPELRDHIDTYKRLAQLYAAVRNAYADKVGFVADLAYKTRRLVEESATQEGLGRLTKSVTFDVKTLEALRSEQGLGRRQGVQPRARPAEGDRRGADDGAGAAATEGSRRAHPEGSGEPQHHGPGGDGLLAALAKEKEEAVKAAQDSGLSPRAFGVFWAMKDDESLPKAGISAAELAKEAEALARALPQRAGQCRRAAAAPRRALPPVLGLDKADRGRIVEAVLTIFLDGGTDDASK